MKKSGSQSAFFTLRVLIGLLVLLTAVFVALFATANPQTLTRPNTPSGRSGASAEASGGAQEAWVARYNGPGNNDDEPRAIAADGTGNIYVTGKSWSSGTDYDYATIKYNSAGHAQWVARYNGPANGVDYAQAIAVDSSGNVYVTGGSLSSISFDYATIKYNSAGQVQWVARYNGPASTFNEPVAITVDNSDNVYVTGTSAGSDSMGSFQHYATIKYNSSGQQQWAASYNGQVINGINSAQALAVDSSGNVYVTGSSDGSTSPSDYATIKYNSAGQQQWIARYNGPGNYSDSPTAIAVDGPGNVYVTGESSGSNSFDYATIKYNSAGQVQWVRRYDGPGNGFDDAQALAIDSSGNIYVTGDSEGSNSYDCATVKYNSAGQQQWVARYNGHALAIAVDGFGNVYVTGENTGAGTLADYATIKYNSSGQEQWVTHYNGPGNGVDSARAIVLDGCGNVYVTGKSTGSAGNFDYVTVKYVENAGRTDFDHDGKTDYVLHNGTTQQTAVWYMHNNVFGGSTYGPALPAGWNVIDVADFNSDGNSDYALFNASTRQTAIWYFCRIMFTGAVYGPTLPSGWQLIATGDFNGDGKPDLVLFKASTRQTAIWYMNNNVVVGSIYGLTLPPGWNVVGVADFNGNGNSDLLLFNPNTQRSAIWYFSGATFVSSVYGPTIASGYQLIGVADFNGDGNPDELLFDPSTRRTAIWYLNNNVFTGGLYGPTLPASWNIVAP